MSTPEYQKEWLKTKGGLAYRANHSEYAKNWRKNNFELKKAIQQRSNIKIKIECLTQYGGAVCRCCGEKEISFLHLDHVNGDGYLHRNEWQKKYNKKAYGGAAFYYWLRKNNWPNEPQLQVLCANCNLGKKNNKYCPHELQKGVDMNGNKIPESELPKPFPLPTKRLRGEAIAEAKQLGVNVGALRQKRWRAKKKIVENYLLWNN